MIVIHQNSTLFTSTMDLFHSVSQTSKSMTRRLHHIHNTTINGRIRSLKTQAINSKLSQSPYAISLIKEYNRAPHFRIRQVSIYSPDLARSLSLKHQQLHVTMHSVPAPQRLVSSLAAHLHQKRPTTYLDVVRSLRSPAVQPPPGHRLQLGNQYGYNTTLPTPRQEFGNSVGRPLRRRVKEAPSSSRGFSTSRPSLSREARRVGDLAKSENRDKGKGVDGDENDSPGPSKGSPSATLQSEHTHKRNFMIASSKIHKKMDRHPEDVNDRDLHDVQKCVRRARKATSGAMPREGDELIEEVRRRAQDNENENDHYHENDHGHGNPPQSAELWRAAMSAKSGSEGSSGGREVEFGESHPKSQSSEDGIVKISGKYLGGGLFGPSLQNHGFSELGGGGAWIRDVRRDSAVSGIGESESRKVAVENTSFGGFGAFRGFTGREEY
jgi:hypothetical protein